MYSIYEIDKHGEKQIILSSPTVEEAETAFDVLRKELPKYKDAEVWWQATWFETDEYEGFVCM